VRARDRWGGNDLACPHCVLHVYQGLIKAVEAHGGKTPGTDVARQAHIAGHIAEWVEQMVDEGVAFQSDSVSRPKHGPDIRDKSGKTPLGLWVARPYPELADPALRIHPDALPEDLAGVKLGRLEESLRAKVAADPEGVAHWQGDSGQ
jgi:hypothetical protein